MTIERLRFVNSLPDRTRSFSLSLGKLIASGRYSPKESSFIAYENYLALLHYLRGNLEKSSYLMDIGVGNMLNVLSSTGTAKRVRWNLIGMLIQFALNIARLRIAYCQYDDAERILDSIYLIANGQETVLLGEQINQSDCNRVMALHWPMELLMNNFCIVTTKLYERKRSPETLLNLFNSIRTNPKFSNNTAVLSAYARALCNTHQYELGLKTFGSLVKVAGRNKYTPTIRFLMELAYLYITASHLDRATFILKSIVNQIISMAKVYPHYVTFIALRTAELFNMARINTSAKRMAEFSYTMSQLYADEIATLKSLTILLTTSGSEFGTYEEKGTIVAADSLYAQERSRFYSTLSRLCPSDEKAATLAHVLGERYTKPTYNLTGDLEIDVENRLEVERFESEAGACEDYIQKIWS